MEKSIDVIIPTYRPDAKFIGLLLALKRQSISPNNTVSYTHLTLPTKLEV